ncbi:hypothetical protein L2E82_12797 [Cichorium intybus]|uniref:Uncharacterized protein n=1 Tax=Cichorium intybus TaxID=13427 RepID=A0ACB9GJ24_CICIN|nr:hypothetical protein L2E82_12797 [Cichorium intybus]
MDIVTRRHIEAHCEMEIGKIIRAFSNFAFQCKEEVNVFKTEIEIANNILLLLFAGHDTSTVTITLVIKSLGQYPDVYEKVLRGRRTIVLEQWKGIKKSG